MPSLSFSTRFLPSSFKFTTTRGLRFIVKREQGIVSEGGECAQFVKCDEEVMLEDGLLLLLAGSEEHLTPIDSFKKELNLVEEMKVQLQEITPAAVELLVLVPVQVPVPTSSASRSKRKFARRAIAKKDKEVKKAAKAEKTSKRVAAKKLKAG